MFASFAPVPYASKNTISFAERSCPARLPRPHCVPGRPYRWLGWAAPPYYSYLSTVGETRDLAYGENPRVPPYIVSRQEQIGILITCELHVTLFGHMRARDNVPVTCRAASPLKTRRGKGMVVGDRKRCRAVRELCPA